MISRGKNDDQTQRKLEKGFAYDVHTLSSVYMGPDEHGYSRYETTRTEMGELVYQLKYKSNPSAIKKIVNLLINRHKGLEKMDAIIPIPSINTNRKIPLVYEITREMGKRIDVPVFEDILKKQEGGQELKNIEDPDERKELLEKYMTITNNHNLADKNILLIDDIYDYGSTLSVATNLLYQQASVKNVFVLTMTKTKKS